MDWNVKQRQPEGMDTGWTAETDPNNGLEHRSSSVNLKVWTLAELLKLTLTMDWNTGQAASTWRYMDTGWTAETEPKNGLEHMSSSFCWSCSML
jgi:hypothetical protein